MGHLLSSGESPRDGGFGFQLAAQGGVALSWRGAMTSSPLGRVGTWGWVWLEVPPGALRHPGLVGLCLQ